MTPTRNPVGWFEIYVNDMPRAKAFYEAVFDTKLTLLSNPTADDAGLEMWQFPGGPDGYGCPGTLCKMDGCAAGGGGTLIYFSCEDCAVEVARVTANGGRYHFQDDQETPDTLTAHFEFGTSGIIWDGSSCHPRKADGPAFVTFYGDGGTLAIDGNGGYRVVDAGGKELKKVVGRMSDVPHFTNFVETIRGEAKLNAPIAEGVKSVHLCHLGNIAWRTGGAVEVDPANGHLKSGTRKQRGLWSREYRRGWNIG